MLGHTLFHSSSIRWATPLVALAYWVLRTFLPRSSPRRWSFRQQTLAARTTRFTGTLDTLAQGLREVPFGSTTVGTQGTLQAELTFETSAQEPPVLVGVKFLENSFNQNAVTLFYDVPGTSRRVTFTASDVKFSLDFKDIVAEPPVEQPPSNVLAAVVDVPGARPCTPTRTNDSEQRHEPIKIPTVRRVSRISSNSRSQCLYGQQPDPNLELADSRSCRRRSMPEYPVAMTVPLSHQQLHY